LFGFEKTERDYTDERMKGFWFQYDNP